MVTFGIEEEYAFVDPTTLHPANASPAVYRALHVGRAESRNVQREFLMSQLERPTPVCDSADSALADLTGFRARLAAAADTAGVIACTSGTFPHPEEHITVVDKDRYRRVLDEFRQVGREYFLNGLHVHVGVPDRDDRVRAMNALRSWMPLITALGANSPLWNGADTGFASWRTVHLQRWNTRGTPPVFADAADYDRRLHRVVGVGATFDDALVAWNMRLSSQHPTIEVRAADMQLDAWHSVLLAVILRALTATALSTDIASPLDPELIDAAVWQAARDGLTGDLVHPTTGRPAPARDVIDHLLEHTDAALTTEGDRERVHGWLDRLLSEGTGADRQRAAFDAGGTPALAALYRAALTAD